ncbi:MAG: flagellar export chaperone FliS [Planctomycetota bacterium]
MAFDINNPYFRTKVLTASPEQLRLMLIEGAIHFMELGRDALEVKNFEVSFENLSQAKAIVLELINALRPEHDPQLAEKLSGLYTFMFTELTQAGFDKDPKRVNSVIRLMEYERETWILLMEKLAKDNGEDSTALSANTLPEVADNYQSQEKPSGPRRPISMQG